MSSDHAATSRWRTRITWAALGAGVTAMLMWNHGASTPRATTHHELGPDPRAPSTEHIASTSDQTRGTTSSTAATSNTTTAGGFDGATTTDATTTDATTNGELDLPTTDTTASGEPLPQIPLPRLPGSRFMRRARRVDEQTGEPIVTLGLSVPAPGAQVEAFYRRAMKDAGLKVFGGRYTSAGTSDDYRSTLKGRSKYASAEVTIHQRSGKLRSLVRVYWRLRD